MKKTNKRGISLIVLVITIIVMIILAAAIILSLSNSGIIGKASEATFKTDVKSMQEELSVKLADVILKNEANTLEGVAAETVLESAEKYEGKFKILDQKLVYIPENVTVEEKVYLEQIGIEEYWDNSQAYLFEIDENGVLTSVNEDYFVYADADDDFYGRKIYADKEHTQEVTEIIIPKGVTSIGAQAFSLFAYVSSIKIPEGVTSIGNSAFDHIGDSVGILEVELPSTLQIIEEFAFERAGFMNLIIPANVQRLENGAFMDCMWLETVTLLGETYDSLLFLYNNLKEIKVTSEIMKTRIENVIQELIDTGNDVNEDIKITIIEG